MKTYLILKFKQNLFYKVKIPYFYFPQGQTTCQGRLGVEDGRITDSQLTASTRYTHNHGATNARLNRVAEAGTTGAWSAQTNDDKQWIQASLGSQEWVTGVLIQGRQDCCDQWVTKFKVQYSNDGEFWKYVQQTESKGEMVSNDHQLVRVLDFLGMSTPVTCAQASKFFSFLFMLKSWLSISIIQYFIFEIWRGGNTPPFRYVCYKNWLRSTRVNKMQFSPNSCISMPNTISIAVPGKHLQELSCAVPWFLEKKKVTNFQSSG